MLDVSMKKRTAPGREFFAQRVDETLVERMKRLAKKMRSNPRAVMEMCLEAHLPELERQFGLREGENGQTA